MFSKLTKSFNLMQMMTKRKMKLIYLSFTDSSFIQTLIENGFNYDLTRNQNQKHRVKFYTRLFRFSLQIILWMYQIIGCWIYWNDQDMILVVGNMFGSLGLPKVTTLASCTAMAVCFMNIPLSMKVFENDSSMMYTMIPMRIIAGVSDFSILPGISSILQTKDANRFIRNDDSVVKMIREELRPLLLLVRIITMIEPTGGVISGILGFLIHSEAEYTVER